MSKEWQLKKLEEVCEEIFAGGDVPKDDHSKVKSAKYNIPIYTNGERDKGLYGYTNIFRVSKPSITVSARGTIGYSEIRNDVFYPAIRLIVLTPATNIVDIKFLKYIIGNIAFKSNGTSIPQLTVPMIKEYSVNIPPILEQKRIVEILDEAFAAIDKAKANVSTNLQNAKELFESYLQNFFANKGEDWEEKRLEDITHVKDGTHDSPKYVKEGIPFVTQKNIREEGLTMNDTKLITEEDHNKFYKRSNVAFGDIIISMIGANRGMACIVDDKRTFSIKNVGLVKKCDTINQEYLLHYLKSPIAKEYIKQSSNGGAQEFVGLTALRNFPILFAPKNEQNIIVENLNELKIETSKLENLYQQKLNDLEELKKSILQKAFNGKLTAKELAI